MEHGVGNWPQSYRGNIIIPLTLRRISASILERQNNTNRIGDIWIPRLSISPNHFVRLYIHVEDLFQNGDRIIRVEHLGSRSCILSWRIWKDVEQRLQYQLESTYEQNFSTLPSDIMPLRLVTKGDQSEFLN
jgi:hypothetical protein